MTEERIPLEEKDFEKTEYDKTSYVIHRIFSEEEKSQILQDHEIVNKLQWEIDKIQTIYEIDHGLTDEQQTLLVALQKIMENKK